MTEIHKVVKNALFYIRTVVIFESNTQQDVSV